MYTRGSATLGGGHKDAAYLINIIREGAVNSADLIIEPQSLPAVG